jgi:hypothetical protein
MIDCRGHQEEQPCKVPHKKRQIVDFTNSLIDGAPFQEKLKAFKEHNVSVY